MNEVGAKRRYGPSRQATAAASGRERNYCFRISCAATARTITSSASASDKRRVANTCGADAVVRTDASTGFGHGARG